MRPSLWKIDAKLALVIVALFLLWALFRPALAGHLGGCATIIVGLWLGLNIVDDAVMDARDRRRRAEEEAIHAALLEQRLFQVKVAEMLGLTPNEFTVHQGRVYLTSAYYLKRSPEEMLRHHRLTDDLLVAKIPC